MRSGRLTVVATGAMVRFQGDPVTPSADWTARLLKVIESPDSYGWNAGKGCMPQPGVAALFKMGTEEAHLLLCFDCDMLSLARPGVARWEDFDDVRPQLVALVKEVFPGDPVIQGLKPRRR